MMDAETFQKELAICRELHGKTGGRCQWGECAKCGVIPLLYKLHKGILLESMEDIRRAKEEALSGKHD